MGSSAGPISGLIEQRRLCEAKGKLLELRSANRRVYGLDEQLAQVERAITVAEKVIAEGDTALAAGKPRVARNCFKKAQNLVADYSSLPEKLEQTEAQLRTARSYLEQAQLLRKQDSWEESLALVRQSLNADVESQTASKLDRELRVILGREVEEHKHSRRSVIIGGVAVVLFIVAGTGLVIYLIMAARHDRARTAVSRQIEEHVAQAHSFLAQAQFDKAKLKLEEASKAFAQMRGLDAAIGREIEDLQRSDTLIRGLRGEVFFENAWITTAERDRIIGDRNHLIASVNELTTLIDARASGRLVDVAQPLTPELKESAAKLHGSLVLVQSSIRAQQFPAASGDYERLVQAEQDSLRAMGLVRYKAKWMTAPQAEEQEMTERGLVKYQGEWVPTNVRDLAMVKYKGRWMTPKDRNDHEMSDKGFVQFDGKWMTREEKFTAEMTAKGMVNYKGRWMSPAEKFEAEQEEKGLVKHDGRWVTPSERDTAQRAELARMAAAQRAERQRQLAAKKRIAFEMSIEFVKDSLKAPSSASFPDFTDQRVTVVESSTTAGHFIVKAYVDAQNSFGTKIRSIYYIELWPVDDDNGTWRAKSPVFEK